MSQNWKQMNKTGKYILISGIIMSTIGLYSFIDDKNIWILSLIVGMYYVGWASWDDRFNLSYVKKGD